MRAAVRDGVELSIVETTHNQCKRRALSSSPQPDVAPLGRKNTVTPVLRLMSKTYIASREQFTLLADFGGPDWCRGEVVGDFGEPIELRNYLDNYINDPMVGSDKSKSFVRLELEADFEQCDELDKTISEIYSNSMHDLLSPTYSLIGRFDKWARTCLRDRSFTDRKELPFRRYCHETAQAMAESGASRAEEETLTFFPGDTMAALLDRSLFEAPMTARLDYLLDKKAEIVTREFEANIEKTRARRRERLDELRSEE